MVRLLMRLFTSVTCMGVVGLFILVPLSLGIWAAARDLLAGRDVEHIVDALEGLAIILIGWGVATEERKSLREMAHLVGQGDEVRQDAIDHLCHSNGIVLLIFGLFAEIGVESVRLPNDIMPTSDALDPAICWVTSGLIAIGGIVLVHHLIQMVATAWFRPQ